MGDKVFDELKEAVAEKCDGHEYNAFIIKCPNCGNFLRFDPHSQKMKCEYCNTLLDTEPCGKAMKLGYTPLSEEGFIDWNDGNFMVCKSCGAKLKLRPYESATVCPFCKASNIIPIDEIDGLKPNGILPFIVPEENARMSFKKWLSGKVLAPMKLRKLAKREAMRGMYAPCFTFDTDVTATYRGRLGEHYTVTVGSGKNRRVETRTRWYNVDGALSDSYNDVSIEASKQITQKDLTKFGGFDTVNAVEYDKQFVSGYYSERYSKSLDESWDEVKTNIEVRLRRDILNRYHADVVDYLNIFPTYYGTTYKYLMVPIWVCQYKYKKKVFGFAVNGRNGKTTGSYPKSPLKIGAIALAIAAAAVFLIWFVMRGF